MISHTTTTEKIVGSLRRIFARFGCPHPFKSDNGPQVLRNVQEFSSGEWHRAFFRRVASSTELLHRCGRRRKARWSARTEPCCRRSRWLKLRGKLESEDVVSYRRDSSFVKTFNPPADDTPTADITFGESRSRNSGC